VGGRARRGGAAVVVVRGVDDAVLVVLVVEHHGEASLVVGRRCSRVGRRVVVGSPLVRARGVRDALVTGLFVVGRFVTGVACGVGGCGSGRVVAPHSALVSILSGRGGTLETECMGAWSRGVACDRVPICSGSGGVVA
jgi:hypothetical protein